MSDSSMIRKQLYITPEQERALKERARREGLTEAEIVREALDHHLQYKAGPVIAQHRRKALEDLMAITDEIADRHRLPRGYTFSREDVYSQRERRWANRRKKE